MDQRSDLYSTGVILFEMLTGRKPYRAETAPALVYQHVHADIPSLPEGVRDFQPIIDILLAKNPIDRFADADEFLQALRSINQAQQVMR